MSQEDTFTEATKRKERAEKGEVMAVDATGGERSAREVFSSYSIRLNERDRDLLLAAAEIRDWPPTRLIRTAATDRARHIVNTGRVTKFNFKRLAGEIAQILFERQTQYATSDDPWGRPAWQDYDPENAPFALKVTPEPLSVDRLGELKKAARLGGAEFLDLVVEYCDALTAARRFDVPEPVEPGAADSSEE